MSTRLDLQSLLMQARGTAGVSCRRHLNGMLSSLIHTVGIDRNYVRGEGPYLWDDRGNRILDCLAGFGAIAVGRAHPVVTDALEQCLRLAPPNWVRMENNALAAEAARRLVGAAGVSATRVFFTNSGTEAVEAAIKFATRHTGRSGLLSWSDSFHGLTCGSLSVNGNDDLREGYGALLPNCDRIEFGDLSRLEQALHSRNVAALIVEPVQGKTLRDMGEGRLSEAHAMCRKHGTLLVADEVQSGCGRTGTFLACHADGVDPDLAVLSKALSGGLVPVGALLVGDDVWNSTYSSLDRVFAHSSTFHEGSLAMTAVIATLAVIEEERLCDQSRALGVELREALTRACSSCRSFRSVLGRGLMIGVDFEPAGVASPASLPMIGDRLYPIVGQSIVSSLLNDHEVLAQVTGAKRPVLKFLPPMTITADDARHIANATASALRSFENGSAYRAAIGAALRLTSARLRGGGD